MQRNKGPSGFTAALGLRFRVTC